MPATCALYHEKTITMMFLYYTYALAHDPFPCDNLYYCHRPTKPQVGRDLILVGTTIQTHHPTPPFTKRNFYGTSRQPVKLNFARTNLHARAFRYLGTQTFSKLSASFQFSSLPKSASKSILPAIAKQSAAGTKLV